MMSAATLTLSRKQIKAVALPAEHGGWGFVLEPIVLGLLLAPSWAGVLLGISAFAVFLIRQPLKLTLVDWRKGKRYDRTMLAERFILIYGAVALIGFVGALLLVETTFLPPLLLAIPLGLIQIVYDAQSHSRHWLPEMASSSAVAASCAAILLADGWDFAPAMAVWTVLVARTIPSILYVRARIRLEKGIPFSPLPSTLSHFIALVVVLVLVLAGYLPVLAAFAIGILLLRGVHGLSAYRRPSPAKVIGFQEMGFGLMLVVMVALGFQLF